MLKSDIKVGGVYEAKVNGRLTNVRVDDIKQSYSGSRFSSRTSNLRREETRYHVTNLSTGRTTVFRSAAKFRKETEAGKAAALRHVDATIHS